MRPDGNKVIWQSAWETHTNIKQLSTSNYGLDWIRQQWRQGKLTRLKMVMHIRWLVKWNNWRIGGSESVRHAVEWVMGTCSHAHGTVGDEEIPLGLSFDKNFLGWLCLLIYPSVMILGIWKLWTQTKLSSQVEANQVTFERNPCTYEVFFSSKFCSFHNPEDWKRFCFRWFFLEALAPLSF